MACSASAFAFFALDGPAAYADLRAAALADYRASAAAASSAAAAAPSAVHPRGAVRCDSGGPADQCSFCVSAAPLEAGREAGGCGACDGCGQPACGACAAARLAACPACGFAACEDCRLQLGEEEDGAGQDVGGRPGGCWCESGSQRDADNHRFVSRERYKAVSMTHPSMRASSMAAAGLRDDEDDGEADGWAFAHGWQLVGGAADDDAITGDGGSGGSSAGAGYGASASSLGGVLLHGAAGGRHGSMELSSDGGSGLRRSMMRYGALGARSRHSGCF